MSSPSLSRFMSPFSNADYIEIVPKLVKNLEAQIQQLANRQEELAELREQVLVDRGKSMTSSKHVYRQREIVEDVEAKLMDAFREHYNRLATPLPITLTSAYVSVENERNKLVHLEDKYMNMQDALGAAEWDLMDAETELYQSHLTQLIPDNDVPEIPEPVEMDAPMSIPLSTTITPSLEVQHQIAVENHDRLVKQFQDLREDYSMTIHFETDENHDDLGSNWTCALPFHLFDSVITQMIDLEVAVRGLRLQLVPKEGPTISEVRHRSDAGKAPNEWFEDVIMMPRAHSDGGIRHVSNKLPNKHFVDHWLLEGLKISSMERTRYKNILRDALGKFNVTTFDLDRWEGLATKWWPSSMIDILKWPGFATSVVIEQTRLQDVSYVAHFPDRANSGPHAKQPLVRPRPTIQIPKDGPHMFINEPRLDTKLDRCRNSAALNHLAAWIKVMGITMLVTEVDPPSIAQLGVLGKDATDYGLASASRDDPLLDVPDSNFQARCDSVYSISPSRSSCTVTCENEHFRDIGEAHGKVGSDTPVLLAREIVIADHCSSVDVMPNRTADEQSAASNCEPKINCVEKSNAAMLQNSADVGYGAIQHLNAGTQGKDKDIRMMSGKNKAPIPSTYEGQVTFGAAHDCISNASSDNRSDTTWTSRETQSTVSDMCIERTRPSHDILQQYPSDTELRRVPVHGRRDFFTLGRVFKMYWPTTDAQDLRRGHSPYWQPSPASTSHNFGTGTRYFVAVKNRGNSSLCLPVQIQQGRAYVTVQSQRRDFGIILASLKPPDTSIRDFFNSYRWRVPGAEELDGHAPSGSRDPDLAGTYAIHHDAFIQDIGRLDQESRLELLDCFLGRSIEDDVSFPSWSRQHTS